MATARRCARERGASEKVAARRDDTIGAIESAAQLRAPVAVAVGWAFTPVRKTGKRLAHTATYDLEYGTNRWKARRRRGRGARG